MQLLTKLSFPPQWDVNTADFIRSVSCVEHYYYSKSSTSSFHYVQLLCKDPVNRLGCVEQKRPIRKHLIFTGMDWDLLENKKLSPPFKPTVVSL